jgi:RNA recognition motif-containing protein
MAGRKIFVGSLPDGCQEETVRNEFGKYGEIEEIFIKEKAEPGRQWAFVTYATAQQAQDAKDGSDRVLQFPGAERPCDVMIAKNQGKFGQTNDGSSASAPAAAGPKKIFVGSLPDNITEEAVREEFSKFGQISDIFLKAGCEPGKQWGFVSYSSHEEALMAKTSTDKVLRFPDSEKTCEVMLARNQGMNGQDPMNQPAYSNVPQGPVKLFIGTLPDSITDEILRAEFSRFGQIVDTHLKTGCESGKQWAFLTFATAAQAQQAKESTDRQLVIEGATNPCEVMFAKNQGKYGQDQGQGHSGHGGFSMGGGQPPAYGQPPPPPVQYPGWVTYFTATGLPYYHNHATGVTQWEMPREIQYAAMAQQSQAMAQQSQAVYGAAMYGGQAMTPNLYGHQQSMTPVRYGPY